MRARPPGPGPLRRARLELVAAGARLATAGLIIPGEGNLSVRVGSTMLITPSGCDKGRLSSADLVVMPVVGSGTPGQASSEAALHLEVYRAVPGVGAVVHAHPPRVLGLSLRNRLPDCRLTIEGEQLLGAAAWVGALPPGSRELALAAAEALATVPAAVLDRHGAVTVGRDLEWAMRRMLLLEGLAELTGEAAG